MRTLILILVFFNLLILPVQALEFPLNSNGDTAIYYDSNCYYGVLGNIDVSPATTQSQCQSLASIQSQSIYFDDNIWGNKLILQGQSKDNFMLIYNSLDQLLLWDLKVSVILYPAFLCFGFLKRMFYQ